MKKIKTFCLILILLFFVFGIISTGYTKKIKLTYANFPPASTFPCVQMERWAKEVEKRTNGKVVVETYPGGTLLGAKEMMDGVIQGLADIGVVCMAYQPGRFKITNAISLPLGIPNATVGSLVLWELFHKYNPPAFSKVKVITLFTSAPSNLMTKKPVRRLEDLKGMDIRASGGAALILKKWGANQIGMPMSDVPEALQKGVIDGLFTSLEVMKDLNFAAICRYITITNTVVYPFAVVMNKSKWNSLPDDVKKVINDLSKEQALWTGNYMDNHVKEAIRWSKEKYNVEVIYLPKDEKIKWEKPLKEIVSEWIKKMKKYGIPGDKVVKDIKALIAKYSKEGR